MVVSYAVDDIVGLIAGSVIGYSIDGLVDCMSAIIWDFLFIHLAVVYFCWWAITMHQSWWCSCEASVGSSFGEVEKLQQNRF